MNFTQRTIFIRTERLLLRSWQQSDLAFFAEINSDPEVMRYFPKPLTREESNECAFKMNQRIIDNGFGFWPAELLSNGAFIGFIGLNTLDQKTLTFLSEGQQRTEIGWRLAKRYWGKGYATEAAIAALHFAFNMLQRPEVVSITTTKNERSQAVMKRIGMTNTGNNFMHPAIDDDCPIREHVLFEVTSEQWQTAQ